MTAAAASAASPLTASPASPALTAPLVFWNVSLVDQFLLGKVVLEARVLDHEAQPGPGVVHPFHFVGSYCDVAAWVVRLVPYVNPDV